MIERWQNDDGSETILVSDDPPRPSLLRRIVGLIGKGFLILLFSLLPIYFFIKGIKGLVTGQLIMWSRTRGSHTLYGSDAVGWSWILIGFAIGSVPYVFRETLASWIKWSLWLMATVCFIAGVFRLVKGV